LFLPFSSLFGTLPSVGNAAFLALPPKLKAKDGQDTMVSNREKENAAGFKYGSNGPHSSRTLMLDSVSKCLDVLSVSASYADYQTGIVDQNILGKLTEATRKESFRRLRELYALDPLVPLFRIYRELDALDPVSRPLLSLLVASARDPLLRATFPVILGSREEEPIGAEHFDNALEHCFPGHFRPAIRAATARHIASTWSQSGHLTGRRPKFRARVVPTPAALVMALLLGTLQGIHGAALFGTTWCQILDLNAAEAQSLASLAHREGLLDLRAVGTVVAVAFPRFTAALNTGDTHEPL
jgi:hypothetical protein